MAIFNTPEKNYYVLGMKLRMHVFEPEESINKEDWYKDLTTFHNSNFLTNYKNVLVGDIVEDDMGARFKVLSRHWKWEKDENNDVIPVLEFTVERYIRRGKQNPYML